MKIMKKSMEEDDKLIGGLKKDEENGSETTKESESHEEVSCLLQTAQNIEAKRRWRFSGYNGFNNPFMSKKLQPSGSMLEFIDMKNLQESPQKTTKKTESLMDLSGFGKLNPVKDWSGFGKDTFKTKRLQFSSLIDVREIKEVPDISQWKQVKITSIKGIPTEGSETTIKSNSIACKRCEKTFNKQIELNLHLKRCCVCTFDGCTQQFMNTELFTKHMKIHKPYSCRKCDKMFVTANALKRHKFVHEGNRFGCTNCPQAFSSKAELQKHIKDRHG